MIHRSLPFLILDLALLILVSSTAFSQTRSELDSTLASVKSLFDTGSYISCELQGRRALEEKGVSDSLRVEFEKYIAFSLVAQGRNDDAVVHFENALKMDSIMMLDTVLTSPKILAVFAKAKDQYLSDKAKNESTERHLGLSEHDFALGEHAGGGPSFRAVLFPGWDQVYQGKTTKGYILLGAGTVAAVSAIASGLLRTNARSDYLAATTPDLASSRYKTYNLYYHTEYYSVSAFILLYAYSALDAFITLPPYLRPRITLRKPSQEKSLSASSFRIKIKWRVVRDSEEPGKNCG